MRLVHVGIRGHSAQVDDWKYDLVSQYPWFVLRVPNSDLVYARREWLDESGRKRVQLMHALITGWPYVDHRDHNGLNCQMYNLREANDSLNQMNARKRRGVSRFKGVSRNGNRWKAEVRLGQRRCYLGTFDTEVDAARAYDAKALELFGEFACTNVKLGLLPPISQV